MNRVLYTVLIFFTILCINPGCTDELSKSEVTLPYDYSDTYSIPISLSILEPISTKDNLIEGQNIELKVNKDVYYKDELLLKSGQIVNAKLETVITSGMNGFPAEIIINNFEIPNIRESQLLSEYIKKGQNRSFLVYPLKWSLTLIPFVGSLTNLIKGGHAKVTPKDKITIYYYPNWK